MTRLHGPFHQLLPMTDLRARGPLSDADLPIISEGGILEQHGKIVATGKFERLRRERPTAEVIEVEGKQTVLPGFVDCHTHICFGGNRIDDFAKRNAGVPYLEIARAGGGIKSSVRHTRAASEAELTELTRQRLTELLERGISTVEVKTGYGLDVENELKMLRAIRAAGEGSAARVVPTCLAAHVVPPEFTDAASYCTYILSELVPTITREQLCTRFDIFVEDTAFNEEVARTYLTELKRLGFDLTVHADQFSAGGSRVAVEVGARSADHLEASGAAEIELLSRSEVVPVALPGASLGLGMAFTPARRLLDAGCSLAIASDWNPGSAPMGDLLTQAGILATYEKLTIAEVLAGISVRAATALGLTDGTGTLGRGAPADFFTYPTGDYRELVYRQGRLQPSGGWVGGVRVVGEEAFL